MLLLQHLSVKRTDPRLWKLNKEARLKGFDASPLLITTSAPASTATVNGPELDGIAGSLSRQSGAAEGVVNCHRPASYSAFSLEVYTVSARN